MNQRAIWQKANFPPEQRLVVISDIHGNLEFFQALLRKINFSPKDVLILLGDMLEKGQENLALLRYIMELEKTHRVYPLCGNCDAYIRIFFQTDQLDETFFREFLARPLMEQSTIRQMGREAGVEDLNDLALLRKTIQKTHLDVWQWLEKLPTILDTEQYFFVHAGVPNMEENSQLKSWDCMKNDYFYQQNHSFPKYMVVGHCPTTLYRPGLQDASPIIDSQRNIISIDGGCVLKLDGQLNALLLEQGEISWAYYDGLPQVQVQQGQEASENPINVRWGHNEVEILQEKGEFCLCRHLESGRTLDILGKFLRKEGDKVLCQDSTDYRLPLSPGERVSLSEQVEGGFLGKKQGITGWYFGEYICI